MSLLITIVLLPLQHHPSVRIHCGWRKEGHWLGLVHSVHFSALTLTFDWHTSVSALCSMKFHDFPPTCTVSCLSSRKNRTAENQHHPFIACKMARMQGHQKWPWLLHTAFSVAQFSRNLSYFITYPLPPIVWGEVTNTETHTHKHACTHTHMRACTSI